MKRSGHIIRCASHLTPMLTPARARLTVKNVVKMIRARGLKFDAIACRGVSGLLIAPIVAMRLRKPLLVVRKGEKTHSRFTLEGDYAAKSYLILDDFIDSGETIKAITKVIYKEMPDARCVGFIAYKRLSFNKAFTPYEEAISFEKQMEYAWWDQETTYIEKFFPLEYNRAQERENEERKNRRASAFHD